MKKIIYLFVMLILISGCATGYHKIGYTGGFSETKIQDGIYKVRFSGNSKCEMGRAEDFVLLRSAEVTLENSYKYFVIVDEKSGTKSGVYTTPATAQTYGTSYGGVYQGTTTIAGGETFSYSKPRIEKTIKCFKENPENISTIVYDAEQVKNNIRTQYNLK